VHQVTTDRVAPADIAPGVSGRVVLVEEVVLARRIRTACPISNARRAASYPVRIATEPIARGLASTSPCSLMRRPPVVLILRVSMAGFAGLLCLQSPLHFGRLRSLRFVEHRQQHHPAPRRQPVT
jgi:hypothetical protein